MRIVCVVFGIIIHSVIAVVTFGATKDYFDAYHVIADSDPLFDFLFSILYFTAIDATLGVLQLNRSGVRLWHWKINTVIASGLLILYFSNNIMVHSVMCLAVFAWANRKLQCEKAVSRVGLSKYIKNPSEDYCDISFARNYKYIVITLMEIFLVSVGCISFVSPLLFVVGDAAHNRLTQTPRTKISDLYVSIFTASMDTGLWMALFNVENEQSFFMDLLAMVVYLLVVEVLVYFNDALIKRCYEILNDKKRMLSFVIWTIIGCVAGPYKHRFATYTFNIAANMLFVYMSADILDVIRLRYVPLKTLN